MLSYVRKLTVTDIVFIWLNEAVVNDARHVTVEGNRENASTDYLQASIFDIAPLTFSKPTPRRHPPFGAKVNHV